MMNPYTYNLNGVVDMEQESILEEHFKRGSHHSEEALRRLAVKLHMSLEHVRNWYLLCKHTELYWQTHSRDAAHPREVKPLSARQGSKPPSSSTTSTSGDKGDDDKQEENQPLPKGF